jgi:hypothetical protein
MINQSDELNVTEDGFGIILISWPAGRWFWNVKTRKWA